MPIATAKIQQVFEIEPIQSGKSSFFVFFVRRGINRLQTSSPRSPRGRLQARSGAPQSPRGPLRVRIPSPRSPDASQQAQSSLPLLPRGDLRPWRSLRRPIFGAGRAWRTENRSRRVLLRAFWSKTRKNAQTVGSAYQPIADVRSYKIHILSHTHGNHTLFYPHFARCRRQNGLFYGHFFLK